MQIHAGCLPEGHNFDGGSRHQHVEFISALHDACRAGRRRASATLRSSQGFFASEGLLGSKRKKHGEATREIKEEKYGNKMK